MLIGYEVQLEDKWHPSTDYTAIFILLIGASILFILVAMLLSNWPILILVVAVIIISVTMIWSDKKEKELNHLKEVKIANLKEEERIKKYQKE